MEVKRTYFIKVIFTRQISRSGVFFAVILFALLINIVKFF